jgi:gamma-D-glutamyl-L-lysine dipeptidyl-peptidase
MELNQKGICRLAIVPLRSEPSDRAEMATQLLFGDHYGVTEFSTDHKWARVTVAYDGYEGWIDMKQHTPISDEYFEHLNHTEFKICLETSSTVMYKKQMIQIVLGSILPITSIELFEVSGQFAFNGSSKNMGEKQGFDFLKQIAGKFMNAPYLWGGKTPFGTDCSGFTQQLFKICGYRLKRDAYQQYGQGIAVESMNDASPGDLAFFHNENGKISHVGVLMEDQDFIHASGFVRRDKLDNKGIFNEELATYTHQLAGIRRILKT